MRRLTELEKMQARHERPGLFFRVVVPLTYLTLFALSIVAVVTSLTGIARGAEINEALDRACKQYYSDKLALSGMVYRTIVIDFEAERVCQAYYEGIHGRPYVERPQPKDVTAEVFKYWPRK